MYVVVSIRQGRLLLFNKEEYVKLAAYVEYNLYFQIMMLHTRREINNEIKLKFVCVFIYPM
jgi:hypothetical protein